MMRLNVLTLFLAVCVATGARANEKFFAAETLEVAKVSGAVPTTPEDSRWAAVPGRAVLAYPQQSVHLNDKAANAAAASRPSTSVLMKAAHDGRQLAVWLEWSDETEDRVRPDETHSFGDSVALEVPVRFGEGVRLPYIGMGDEGEHVQVYMQRATNGGSQGNEYVAAGFGSLTRTKGGEVRMAMSRDGAQKKWRALFVRPLVLGKHSLEQELVPFALAVWDGGRHERGGNKALSSWKFLRLKGFRASARYLQEVSYGYGPGEAGDAAKGKALVETVCMACHWVGERKVAPPGMAPDLSGIGGIATHAYLRDSVVDPGAVVVPNLNVNQHYGKSEKPDSHGAYPNNAMYQWYATDGSGKKLSKMPPFGSMPKEDIANVVAYMKTLGTSTP